MSLKIVKLVMDPLGNQHNLRFNDRTDTFSVKMDDMEIEGATVSQVAEKLASHVTKRANIHWQPTIHIVNSKKCEKTEAIIQVIGNMSISKRWWGQYNDGAVMSYWKHLNPTTGTDTRNLNWSRLCPQVCPFVGKDEILMPYSDEVWYNLEEAAKAVCGNFDMIWREIGETAVREGVLGVAM